MVNLCIIFGLNEVVNRVKIGEIVNFFTGTRTNKHLYSVNIIMSFAVHEFHNMFSEQS